MKRPNLDGIARHGSSADTFLTNVVWTSKRYHAWIAKDEWLMRLDIESFFIFWLLVLEAEGAQR